MTRPLPILLPTYSHKKPQYYGKLVGLEVSLLAFPIAMHSTDSNQNFNGPLSNCLESGFIIQ